MIRIGSREFTRGVSPRTLFALALCSPPPAAVNPRPSARVLLPIAGSEGRAVGGLDIVLPRLPNVLSAIPGPMTGVPRVAGQRRRHRFCYGRWRWCCDDCVGRRGRRRIIGLREQFRDFGSLNHRYRREGGIHRGCAQFRTCFQKEGVGARGCRPRLPPSDLALRRSPSQPHLRPPA